MWEPQSHIRSHIKRCAFSSTWKAFIARARTFCTMFWLAEFNWLLIIARQTPTIPCQPTNQFENEKYFVCLLFDTYASELVALDAVSSRAHIARSCHARAPTPTHTAHRAQRQRVTKCETESNACDGISSTRVLPAAKVV